jgi:hypothetical protein
MTTQFIHLVNKVLENCGERPVISFNSAVARKVSNLVKDAMTDVAYSHEWNWLTTSVIANSWLKDVADVGDVQTVKRVMYGTDTTGYREIRFVDEASYNTQPVYEGVAQYFTFSEYGEVRVNPYPITNEEQIKYKFFVVKNLILPLNETDTINIPDRFVPLVSYNACKHVCVAHLDDANAAQMWNIQYENQLSKLRARERNTPQGGVSMFKFRGVN